MWSPMEQVTFENTWGVKCLVCREKSSAFEMSEEKEICRQPTLCLDLMYSEVNVSVKLEDAKV